ncbi:MAG: hypothetical protein HW375_42 [Anaerolineales bacterium]|nr:hypothetical protein [Anaerolineales bacterium]
MAGTYEEARTAIKTALATVAITSPIVQSIKKVYEYPPATLQDRPCFVMWGSEMDAEWMMGGLVDERVHTEHFQLFLQDSDIDQGFKLVMAYRAALLTALKTQGGLGGHATVERLRGGRPAELTYDAKYIGAEFFLTFHIKGF